jgi:hypothetical protein
MCAVLRAGRAAAASRARNAKSRLAAAFNLRRFVRARYFVLYLKYTRQFSGRPPPKYTPLHFLRNPLIQRY